MHPNRVYIVGAGTGATAEATKRVIAFTTKYLGFFVIFVTGPKCALGARAVLKA